MKKLVSIALVLVLLGSVGAYAAFPSSVKIDQTFQDGGDLSVVFHANDGSGADMSNLTEDSVSVTLDGQTLPARLEPANAGGIGYVFAVDVSTMLTNEQFAAVRESLKSWIGAMGLRDRAAIVTFGAQVSTVMELTDNVTTLLMALDGLTPADPEAMLCGGAVRAVEVAAGQGEGLPSRRVVVLVSNGRGSSSDTADMEAVRARAVESGIPLYAAEASEADNGEELAVLSDAVQATGGRAETGAKDALSGGLERLRTYIGSGTCAVAAVPEGMADGSAKTLVLTVVSEGVSVSDSRDLSLREASDEETADSADSEDSADTEETENGRDWDMKQFVPYIAVGCGGVVLALVVVLVVSAAKKRKTRRKAARTKKTQADVDQGYGNYYEAPSPPVMRARPESGPGMNDTVSLEPDRPANMTMPLSSPVTSRLVLTDNRNRKAYSAPLQDRITVGREDGMNQIVLRDASVSARHCEIFREGGRVIVRDMNSTNGTRLLSNGVRYTVDANTGRDIRMGDVLEIGGTALEVTGV